MKNVYIVWEYVDVNGCSEPRIYGIYSTKARAEEIVSFSASRQCHDVKATTITEEWVQE